MRQTELYRRDLALFKHTAREHALKHAFNNSLDVHATGTSLSCNDDATMKSDREKELTKVEGCDNEAESYRSSDKNSDDSDSDSDSDSENNDNMSSDCDSDENEQFDDVGVGQKRPLRSQ